MKTIFVSLRQEVSSVVRKVYFEFLATDRSGQILKRENGAPYPVELDMFIGRAGVERGQIFINGEIEFHGATQQQAIAEAALWQKSASQRPPYFSQDLTDVEGVKSRDIAIKGVPEFVTLALAPYHDNNALLFKNIAGEFATWADPSIAELIFSHLFEAGVER